MVVAPMLATIVAESAVTGSESTRWFHGLSAGKMKQFGAPGTGLPPAGGGGAPNDRDGVGVAVPLGGTDDDLEDDGLAAAVWLLVRLGVAVLVSVRDADDVLVSVRVNDGVLVSLRVNDGVLVSLRLIDGDLVTDLEAATAAARSCPSSGAVD